MKRFILILMVVAMLFTAGCSSAWYEHDTIYKTNDHMAFSLWGYQDADQNDLTDQNAQGGWWGEEIPVK